MRACFNDKRSRRDVSFRLSTNEEEDEASEGALTASEISAVPEGDGEYSPPKFVGIKPVPSMNTLNLLERQGFVMHKKPFQTLHYSVREIFCVFTESSRKLWLHRNIGALLLTLAFLFYFAYRLPGQHQQIVHSFEKKLFWCAYWLGLGILSSIGFGTGLHTFLLYLGPHIASVTLAAFECGSLMFPEPPYPDEIICPDAVFGEHPAAMANSSEPISGSGALIGTFGSNLATVSIWNIMSKVRLEAIMWGAGTALGELPPYFMARAARLSGQEPDDEEYREFKQFLAMTEQWESRKDWLDEVKLTIERLIEKVGFLAILICASIPNPLFDLAGITCGHFLVPFWKFFGSTLIGKAIVKTHIQKFFVIVAFSEQHFEKVLNWLRSVPKVGPRLEKPFRDFLNEQKMRLHRSSDIVDNTKSGIVQRTIETIVFVMIASFVVSLVNSLAQRYHRRLWEEKKKKMQNNSLPDKTD
uniref:Vacuole membrane protein 1 n=1 Tax=Trichuris muris TaxID=70415 RepID=A0A5S6QR03_TRIMR